jgi:hypothetical protein
MRNRSRRGKEKKDIDNDIRPKQFNCVLCFNTQYYISQKYFNLK